MKPPICIYPRIPEHFNGLCIIGEAPGAEEEKLGLPFVGPSGKLLDYMLEKAEIKRQDCYIINVFHRRPPFNQLAAFFGSGDPTELHFGPLNGKWLKRPFDSDMRLLKMRLRRYRPHAIIALGSTAVWAMLGEQRSMGMAAHDNPHLADGWFGLEAQVFALYHPSYLLRTGGKSSPYLEGCINIMKGVRDGLL